MGKLNGGNWGALINGGYQGFKEGQDMESQDLKNKYYKDALVDPAHRVNSSDGAEFNWEAAGKPAGGPNYQQVPSQGMLFDPVRNKMADVYKSAKAKLASFLPGQGQHAMGPASQSTVPAPGNAAMSPPSPTSSSSSGGMPGPTGPMPLPDQPTTQGQPYADGGIPGRGRSGALRMRKAKPGNVGKPTKAANAAMHPPMQKAPVDAQEMGAEGGPPRNTEASPGSQDPMLANGGFLPARLNPKPPKYQPQPNPNSFEKNQKNDDQLSRFSRVEKKFADGDEVKLPRRPGQDKSGPAAGLEPAEPESTGHHLAAIGSKFLGLTALDPDSPYQQASGLLQRGVRAAGDYLSSPWEEAPTGHAASPGSSGAVPAAPPPPAATNGQYGPLSPDEDPSINVEHGRPGEVPPDDMQTTDQNGNPITPYSKSGLVAALGGKGGGGAVPGRSAGPAALPEQGPAAPGAPPAGASPQADEPMDFSHVDINHQDIPTTHVEDWDQMKRNMEMHNVAHGMAPGQAQMAADDQVSQFQHQNFVQYLAQGAALDRAGNKKGAMAAYKTAYQYMPTGHDMDFSVTTAPQTKHDGTVVPAGTIVGFGRDEKTGQPVGQPMLLDQANVNGLAATFADPKNFQAMSLEMQKNARENRETNAKVPVYHSEAQRNQAMTGYYTGLDQERRDIAQMRLQGQLSRHSMDPQTQRFYAQQLNGTIMDPAEQGQALATAGSMESKYGNSPEAQAKIAGFLKQLYSHPPEVRNDWAKSKGIDLDTMGNLPSQQDTMPESAIPGR